MENLTLILMCAGDSLRFTSSLPPTARVKKQWLYVHEKPLWLYVHDKFKQMGFSKIIIAANSAHVHLMRKMCDAQIVQGSDTRAKSVLNALACVKTDYVCISDVARFGVELETMKDILKDYDKFACSAFYQPCADALLYESEDSGLESLDKRSAFLIQTPQISQVKILKEGLSEDCVDETQVFLNLASGHMGKNGQTCKSEKTHKKVKREKSSKTATGHDQIVFAAEISLKNQRQKAHLRLIRGSKSLEKLTSPQDLYLLDALEGPSSKVFIGTGFDVHSFESGKTMKIGGIEIGSDFGFKAHSDGDVLLHAIADALLGAAGLGDIGEHFPDTLEENRGLDSKKLLKKVSQLVISVGYEVVNVDCTLILERPKIAPLREDIERSIAGVLGIKSVNLKATTMEKMGFIGRAEGACAMASVSLRYLDWKSLA